VDDAEKFTDRPYGVISTVARARIEYFGFFEYFRACAVITQRARIEYVGTCAVVS
jgi:hypothetical protein